MAGIYERVEVEARTGGEGPVEVIAVLRPDWAPFFRELANRVLLERETSASRAAGTQYSDAFRIRHRVAA